VTFGGVAVEADVFAGCIGAITLGDGGGDGAFGG
jgi:hypothetical protein